MYQVSGVDDGCKAEDYVRPPSKNEKDLEVQLVLSLILGGSALIAFCILRPRWPSLYAARKRRLGSDVSLPSLPDSFFGWIPKLYSVTEEQVLAWAGLDAFVFLTFFKMAIRLFSFMAFFAMVVLWPLNSHYRNFSVVPGDGEPGKGNGSETTANWYDSSHHHLVAGILKTGDKDKSGERTYLWAYVVFTYFFVALTIYSINWETFRIIKFRQDYLGSQSTVTDRTFRLTGIPERLRSEQKLKELIEKLEIGLVETVTLCRKWRQLDVLVDQRNRVLRKLEGAWANLLRKQRWAGKLPSAVSQSRFGNGSGDGPRQERGADAQGDESTGLLAGDPNRPHVVEDERPQMKIRYGLFKLRTRKVDAIDHYEEQLRRLDSLVLQARNRDYETTDMALVTMDSVASCQMVIQARIDPRPGWLLTKPTPSPSDLVWKNTYAPRGIRRLKSWSITLFITVLTLLWIFPTAILASWLSICTIKRLLPSFASWLSQHPLLQTLFQNGAPTLVVSLLNVAVPYLYDWLSNHQGMISHGDVELSVISKNFFFTFFNTFFVFAVSRTGFDFWSVLGGMLKDTSKIPAAIAADVEDLSIFYISFIMLQGIGLMPFRILELGSVLLVPLYRVASTTPRDFAELRRPPVFQYGFYLPTALLVFNLCLIYSVLMWGFAILVFGTVYFALGYLTYKYMVLYAMDQPQHATGGAWRIICYRIVIGLVVFEVVMVGQIASLSAFVQSVTVVPLIPFTVWYSYYFRRRYEPLTRIIALRAIRKAGGGEGVVVDEQVEEEEGEDGDRRARGLMRRGSTVDEYKEKGQVFVNPSLVVPLDQPWIYKDPPPPLSTGGGSASAASRSDSDGLARHRRPIVLPDADRVLGIGENNVWADGAR